MHANDQCHRSPETLQAEVERLRREVTSLEAAGTALRLVLQKCETERDAFRAAFDAAAIPMLWFDRQGRLLRANRASLSAVEMEAPPADFSIYNDPQLIALGVPGLFRRALEGETVRMPRYVYNPSRTLYGAPDRDMVLESLLLPVHGQGGEVESVMVQHFRMR